MTYQPNFGPSVALEKAKAPKADPVIPAKPDPVISLEVEPDQFSRTAPVHPLADEVPKPALRSPGFLAGLRRRFAQPQNTNNPNQQPPVVTTKQASRFNHQNA